MKRLILIITILFTCGRVHAQKSLPAWFSTTFKNSGLSTKYSITPFIKPAFFESDFNGDKISDIAVLVTEIKTKKKGILLIHGKTNQHYLFGAGTKFGNGGDNFRWMGRWSIYKDKIADEGGVDKNGDLIATKKIKLSRIGLLITDLEDGQADSGGIIYWTGVKYIWIHQGE
jgi:hypothetical protein